MKIGLLGHGTIGIGVDHIVKTVPGMEVKKILSLIVDDEMAGRTASGIDDILNDSEIDTVVEVMGGIHPAYEFLSAAINAGKNIVTANKAVVAAYYRELNALAKAKGVSFRATAAVGGGIPWLTSIESKNRIDRIVSLSGIMNGTTNYILSTMEDSILRDGTVKEGAPSFEDVLKRAQELGYAEKDPTADIDGYDVRRKVTISANAAFGVVLDEETVPTFGIRNVKLSDLKAADEKGAVIRLVAEAARDGEDVCAAVMPCFVKKTDMEANVRENYNLFTLTGECTGVFKFYGQGAGRYPTAGNVVSDLRDILEKHPGFYTEDFRDAKVSCGSEEACYYVRTKEQDDYLLSVTAEEKDGAVFTKKVKSEELIPWALEKQKRDKSFFIARVM